jgi:hypothetical protein
MHNVSTERGRVNCAIACVTQKYYPSLRDPVGSEFACRVSGQLLTIWHLTSDMPANQIEFL